MKILFSSNKNPYFLTFTDYIEKSFRENGCDVFFFENRDFIMPGRMNDAIPSLKKWDLKLLNKKLISMATSCKPDMFLEAGGWNILPDTLVTLKDMGIKTALWTVDPPRIFKSIIESAPYYDSVFTQGSEAYEILNQYNIKKLNWMPFACDSDLHRPVELTDDEQKKYVSDVCFVGSGGDLYLQRREELKSLTDFNLGIWGPGWESLPDESQLHKFIRGGQTGPEEWVKIFSAAKVVFHSHYHDPSGKVPCHQASPRVYEALACGAFFVCDNQRDVLRLFKNGEHLIVFKSIQELREIIDYYLKHPAEAKSIAEKGRKEAVEKHTFKHRTREILSRVMHG
jgi:spore maturation protein CgeB